MKLSTKLFLIVGSLFLLVCLAVFLLPEYIIRVHIKEDRETALQDLEARRRKDQEQYFSWLGNTLNSLKGFIDANLIVIADQTYMQQLLELDEPTLSNEIWYNATNLLWNVGDIDFLQIIRNEDQVAAIAYGAAPFFEAFETRLDRDLSWIVTPHGVYLGVWYPEEGEELDPDALPALFLLFDAEKVWQGRDHFSRVLERDREKIEPIALFGEADAGRINIHILKALARAEEELRKRFTTREALQKHLQGLAAQQEMPKETSEPLVDYFSRLVGGEQSIGPYPLKHSFAQVLRSEDDLDMMNAIGLVCGVGAICKTPFDETAPVGVLHSFAQSDRGVAIFSRDVFYDHFLFHPQPGKVRLSLNAFDLVPEEKAGVLTLVNTMFWEGEGGNRTAITMGVRIGDFVDELADISGESSFLIHRGKILDFAGEALTNSAQKELVGIIPTLDKHGRVTLDGRQYFYSRYVPEQGWDMSFVTLQPVDEAMQAYDVYLKRSRAMLRRFSLQLLALAAGLFILSLLALELIARQFTKPIRVLAAAADRIGQGHYEGVELPKAVEGSKDEVSVLTHAFGSMVIGLQERETIRAALDKVVSKEVANEILKGEVELGGEVREVTVLFGDIRNFTHLTESLPPEEVISFLNGYMTRMAEVIEAHLGVIDKYVGDEIMALYGAPVRHRMSTLQAVLSAIMMRSSLEEWNRERSAQGIFTAEAGIGVHTGKMVAGNMGAESRLNYTVLGANVNLASRLCDQAKPGEILVTEAVLQAPEVADSIETEMGEKVQFKGITEPVQVYRVIGLKRGKVLKDLSEQLRQFVKDE